MGQKVIFLNFFVLTRWCGQSFIGPSVGLWGALNPNYPAHHLKPLPAIHTEAATCREPEQGSWGEIHLRNTIEKYI